MTRSHDSTRTLRRTTERNDAGNSTHSGWTQRKAHFKRASKPYAAQDDETVVERTYRVRGSLRDSHRAGMRGR